MIKCSALIDRSSNFMNCFLCLQLNIKACDDNTPTKCDEAIAKIKIIRSDFPPVFLDTPYRVSVSEYRDVDSSIFRVMAEDKDKKGTVVYGTKGVAPAPTYFSVDSATGVIRVARNLSHDRTTVYTVSCIVFSIVSTWNSCKGPFKCYIKKILEIRHPHTTS